MTFKVRLTRDAEADLERLFDFLVERELARDGGDLYLPEQAMAALRAGIATLKSSPFTCRKAGNSPFLRELIIPFGRSGYVALFEIEDDSTVAVVAVRHQLEDDYHVANCHDLGGSPWMMEDTGGVRASAGRGRSIF